MDLLLNRPAGWCGGLPSTLSAGGSRRQMPGLRVENLKLDNCRDLVAEYGTIAPNRRAAHSAARRPSPRRHSEGSPAAGGIPSGMTVRPAGLNPKHWQVCISGEP